MPWWLYLASVGWAIGWLTAVALLQPEDAAEGAMVFVVCAFVWPLFAIGWLVSRPFA